MAEKSSERLQFATERSKFYWEMRELFEGGIMIPPDEELEEELSNIRYKVVDSSGQIRIADKSELRKDKHFGRSPDRADSPMLTVAHGSAAPEAFVVLGEESFSRES